MVFVFDSKKTGRLGGWLKHYGWLHKWAMFTSQSNPYKKIAFYYRDKNQFNEITDWVRVDAFSFSNSKIFINTKEREFAFYSSCSLILSKRISQGSVNIQEEPIFKFVSQVICDLSNPSDEINRQIKLVQFNPKGDNKCIYESKFLPVNGN
jgi:hypothetical protein